MSVCLKRFGGNVIFSAPMKDRRALRSKINYNTSIAVGLIISRFLTIFFYIFHIFSHSFEVYGPISKIFVVRKIEITFPVVLRKHPWQSDCLSAYFWLFLLYFYYFYFFATLRIDVFILVILLFVVNPLQYNTIHIF